MWVAGVRAVHRLLEPVQGAEVRIFATGYAKAAATRRICAGTLIGARLLRAGWGWRSHRGGAHHREVIRKFREALGVEITALDELSSVVQGLNAMIRVRTAARCLPASLPTLEPHPPRALRWELLLFGCCRR